MKYRADVDGLRAIAVLSVLLFHFTGIGWFNGYMGVDIFFVISGYLITRIISAEMLEGRFSLWRFYERRARRILPALFTVIALTAVFAYCFFLPREMVSFAKSLIGAPLFASNIVFWLESGYFDLDAVTKPLLHTWSLGIEEQFYIFYPLILWAVYRFARHRLPVALVILWLASFASNIAHIASGDQGSAFYLIHARAWELLSGAVIALNIIPKFAARLRAGYIAYAGLLLLLTGFFLDVDKGDFPGWAALFPVLGTSMLIYAGRDGAQGRIGRILSWPVMAMTGRMSYSLYLWHWPIFVFASYHPVYEPGGFGIAGMIALCFFLSYLSWRYVEQPFRNPGGVMGVRMLFLSAAMVSALFAALGVFLLKRDGVSYHLEPDIIALLDAPVGNDFSAYIVKDEPAMEGSVMLGVPDREPGVLLWGDSHALAFSPAIDLALKHKGKSGAGVMNNSCLVPLSFAARLPAYPGCPEQTDEMLSYIERTPSLHTVVLANRWSGHLRQWMKKADDADAVRAARADSLVTLVQRLEGMGRRVVVIGPTPEIDAKTQDVPSIAARIRLYGLNHDIRPRRAGYDAQAADMQEAYHRLATQTRATIILPADRLCDDTICEIMRDGRLLYYDDDHLSRYGAEQFAPDFEALF